MNFNTAHNKGKLNSGRRLILAFCLAGITFPGIAQPHAWQLETSSAKWQPRDSQGQLVYHNYMWIFGGWFSSQEAPPRDVWRSDNGKNWELVTQNAPWKHSDFPMAVTFRDRMWLMGGWYNGRMPGHEAGNEVWSSQDGVNWQLETKAAWSPRLAGAVVEFRNKLWLFGGTENYYFGDEKSLKNDIWVSDDGKKWELVTESAEWPPRAYHQVVVFNKKLYLMAGGNYTPEYRAFNDVWVSDDGKTWTKLTGKAPWHERLWFTSTVYRDRLWVLGGWSNNPSKNWDDAWYTADGINWTRLESSPVWKERHAQATFVFQDKLWIAGGMTPPLVNDVWSLTLPKKWKPKK